MVRSEDEEEAIWVLLKLSYSLPMETKRSVVEAVMREERVFIHAPRKKRTLRIPVSYSTEDPPPLEQQQPKKEKRNSDGRFEAGASSSGETRERTPEWLLQLIRCKNGERPKEILNKSLTASDVDSGKYRLSIPLSKIVDADFLTPEEEKIIDLQYRKLEKTGVNATLVASDLREFGVDLRLWPMGKTQIFNLVTGWNQVVRDCQLRENDQICIWSFHANEKLYFAFVPLLPPLNLPILNPGY